ncbi:hypothetical protein B296_00045930 [Ensete ventricosum]|uniref:Uncharacterized protein n=1 Tax=Ensete ventricosum TaxID=4639 RepID=A0A426Z5S6_ENSVE|nr:hypothetical protein B296_00045930 [Ensete ventricosum]
MCWPACGTAHVAPYRCNDTWYAGAYWCFDKKEKEVEEEGPVEEQRKKEKEEEKKKRGGEEVQQYLRISSRVEGKQQHHSEKRQCRCDGGEEAALRLHTREEP